MLELSLKGKTVLVTGATRGIGLAVTKEFSRRGARVFGTYKWGSADLEKTADQCEQAGGTRPIFLEADVSLDEDTDRLLEAIRAEASGVDIFVSNVGFAQVTPVLDDYKKRSLFKTLEYSSWPLVEYTRRMHSAFGHFPDYVIGISSDGPDHFYPGYDFVGASKALLEFFGRYLSCHLMGEKTRVNIVRFGPLPTESFQAVFGKGFFSVLEENGVPAHRQLTLEQCGSAVLALCSGLLDALHGQVLTIDHGITFMDNSLNHYMNSRAGKED